MPTIPLGGLLVSRRTSNEVAPADCQLKFGGSVTPTLPSATPGEFGVLGAMGGADEVVVNDHTGPAVDPLLFFAVTCQ